MAPGSNEDQARIAALNIGEQAIYIPKDEKGKYKSYDSAGEAYNDTVEVMDTPAMRGMIHKVRHMVEVA